MNLPMARFLIWAMLAAFTSAMTSPGIAAGDLISEVTTLREQAVTLHNFPIRLEQVGLR
jgi:hypothetical protein